MGIKGHRQTGKRVFGREVISNDWAGVSCDISDKGT